MVEQIPIDKILPNPYQTRKGVDEEEELQLAQSMASVGLLSPIKARPHPTLPGYYELVYGERRVKAGRLLEWETIPAIVEDVSDREVAIQNLVENLQRISINPLEEAQGYKHLRDEFKYTVSQIASTVGKSRPFISNSLRLLDFDPFLQACVLHKTISSWHARIINSLPAEYEKFRLADLVMDWSLSVNETRNIVNSVKDGEILFSWVRNVAIDGIRIHPSDDFTADIVRSKTLESLAKEGQREPIDVMVIGVLINDPETYFAVKKLGWTTIKARVWFFTEWLRMDPDDEIVDSCSDVKLLRGIIPEATLEQRKKMECLVKHLSGQREKYPILTTA